jgi:hypothetical protein
LIERTADCSEKSSERSGPTNLNTPLSGFSAESGHDTPQKIGEPHEQTIPP